MFIGLYRHGIDIKNRLFIPAKFRNPVRKKKGQYILTCGLEDCLFLYTKEDWIEITKKLKNLPLTKKDARQFLRIFISGASECELDVQGRILIPKTLIDYAQIKKDAVILGLLDRIEIWAQESWDRYHSSSQKRFSLIAEKLVDLGI